MYEYPMILALLWKGSLFVLVSLLINRLCYAHQPALRCRVWMVTFAAMLCLPLFGRLIPYWMTLETSITLEIQSRISSGPQEEALTAHIPGSQAKPDVLLSGGATDRAADLSDTLLSPAAYPRYIRLMGWLVFALISCYYLAGHLYMQWVLQRARPASHLSLLCQLETLRSHLGIRSPVHLRLSSTVKGPVSYGIVRNYIILPGDHAWQEEELRFVLAHELAHIQRKDLPIQLFVQLIIALNWFNPLVWVAYRRFKLDRELACDDHVVKNTDIVAADYAGFLLETARSCSSDSWLMQPTLQLARRTELEGRLLAILSDKKAVAGKVYPLLLAGGLLITLAGFTVQPKAILPLAVVASSPHQDHTRYIMKHLKEVLNDDDLEVRIEALRAIDEIGGITALADILGSSSQEDAALIKQAVHHVIGADQDMDIEQMITSGNKKVQKKIIRTLERLKDQETVRLITLALQDEDAEIREQAADALSAMDVPEAAPLLIAALNDPDGDVRAEAADGLGDIHAEIAVPYLVRALNDSEDEVRKEAAIALGQIGSAEGLEHLIAKIHDRDRDVREAAIDALGKIKNQKALEPLLKALSDQNREVRRKAVASIRKLFE